MNSSDVFHAVFSAALIFSAFFIITFIVVFQ